MGILRSIVRTSAFITKEIAEILRQPRLILTLVLGPFLILLLFGIGYRNQARALRTVFVVSANQEGNALADEIKQYASTLGPQLVFEGVTDNEEAARNALLQRQVDLVVLAPQHPYETIRTNQQATFTLLHNEIDPLQVDYVKYFGQVYVAEVNRRVLQSMAEQGQQEAATAQQDVKQARSNAAELRAALTAGDMAAASQHQQDLSRNVGAAELALGTAAGLISSIQGATGDSSGAVGTPPADGGGQATAGADNSAGNLRSDLESVRQGSEALASGQGDVTAQTQNASRLESDLARLDADLTEFRNVDPGVIVQPFHSDVKSIATVQPTITDYFAPSVIALLLQHLAVTFAALSIVREGRLGAMEFFRVSPISAFETLLGKYIGYMIFAGLLSAILSLLLIYVLKVPLLGDPRWYVAVLATLLFTSLGFGFVISLASQTDSQAVQFAMILLLSSVFFSGFMLSLDNLIQPVRIVSWLLPATYGINLLQNIMLRGYFLQPELLGVLLAMGVALFIVSWFMLRRRMAAA